jgi:transcriptional regulator with XRE-family HTH domain
MSIATSGIPHTQIVEFSSPANEQRQTADQPLHRVAEVRQQQGVSLRTAARHMNKDMATVRQQEKPTTDMRLSELAAWQQVLDVPLVELLVDSGAPLSRPVMERARLVRLMKTAASIKEKSESIELKRLAKTLTDQLIEIMPELAEISAWHSVGQRRSLDEMGRVAERRLRDDFFVVYRED